MQAEVQIKETARTRRSFGNERFCECGQGIRQHVADVASLLHQKETQTIRDQSQKCQDSQRIRSDDRKQRWSGAKFYGLEQTLQFHRCSSETRLKQSGRKKRNVLVTNQRVKSAINPN